MKTILSVLAIACVASSLVAQVPLRVPRVDRDLCPYECCRLGAWTTTGPTPVYRSERDTTRSIALLPAGTHVVADRANLHTLVAGIVILQRDVDIRTLQTVPDDSSTGAAAARFLLHRGDTVFVVGNMPEEGPIVWAKGWEYVTNGIWWSETGDPVFKGDAAAAGVQVRPMNDEWWVHIRFGTTDGWVDAYRRPHFDGADSCAN